MIILAAATALVGGLIQGVTGFGSGIILMLVLPLMSPMPQAAAISGAACIALTASMAWRYRACIQLKTIIGPVLLYILASSISITLTHGADQGGMKIAVGVFLVLVAAYSLHPTDWAGRPIAGPIAILFIVVSGACDGAFGIGGPLMVAYYLSRMGDVREYLGTMQAFFCVTLVFATAFRLATGVIGASELHLIAACVIGVLAGANLGARVVDRLDGETLKKATYFVIGISGVLNVASGIGGLIF